MNCILSTNIFPGDWGQFIPSIVATLLGIVAPVLIAWMAGKLSRRKEARQIVTKIRAELKEILEEQLPKIRNDKMYVSPLKTPEWDGLINTNEIQHLADFRVRRRAKLAYKKMLEEKYKGKENGEQTVKKLYNEAFDGWIRKLFNLYALIDEFNEYNNITLQAAANAFANAGSMDEFYNDMEVVRNKLINAPLEEEDCEKGNNESVPKKRDDGEVDPDSIEAAIDLLDIILS